MLFRMKKNLSRNINGIALLSRVAVPALPKPFPAWRRSVLPMPT